MKGGLVLCLAFVALSGAAPAGDEVKSLPGINFAVDFQHYSGYLNGSPTHKLHYWFVLSQNNPATDPVLLWLNGGPGCSSLIALMEENGPFRVKDFGQTVYENVYSWNKVANVLYLEAPAGVGFSYATDGNITTNDDQTALENYQALIDFFTNKFPEYQANSFYISGESYAGIYIPTLGALLIKDPTHFPNFKGMAVGNGFFSMRHLTNSYIPFIYYHSLISYELWTSLNQACCGGVALPYCDFDAQINGCPDGQPCNQNCFNLYMNATFNVFDSQDPYYIYDTCYLDSNSQASSYKSRILGHRFRNFNRGLKAGPPGNIPKPLCAQLNDTAIYLNRAEVKKALNILQPITWSECSDDLSQNGAYNAQYTTTMPQVKAIVNSGARVLVFNGDADTICDALGDQWFTSDLNLPQIRPKQGWYYNNDNPSSAGFVTRYQGLDFLTVRGAGHLVPSIKPREALQMIANFLRQKDYSTATGINTYPQPLPPHYDVAYCLVPVTNISFPSNGSRMGYQMCQNGACRSTSNGAICVCYPGWTGAFCDTPVSNQFSFVQFCALYETAATDAHNLPVGCQAGYNCLAYDMRCNINPCSYPLGFCLPNQAAPSFS